jgi:tRNA A37 threonylcarbamoyladenosine synthetase subunit TsaC/SUA5/YrdC
MCDAEDIRDRLEKRIDLVIECGACGIEMTTVINLSGPAPELIRAGKGDPAVLGLG